MSGEGRELPVDFGDRLLEHSAMGGSASELQIREGFRAGEVQGRASALEVWALIARGSLRRAVLGRLLLSLDTLAFPATCHAWGSLTSWYPPPVLAEAHLRCGRFLMAPVVPDPKAIKSFRSGAAFETWLRANHARADEIWMRIYKKASGTASVTHAQALDVALCWGWIDGIRKGFDDASFLQRFTPRRSKSIWSQVNQTHVKRLVAAGRMRPAGQRQIDAAKADGRWAAAYAPMRSASAESIPADLRAAIDANPRARRTFQTLSRQNLFALAFRTTHMKTAAGRARKIAELVAGLARGETPVPQG